MWILLFFFAFITIAFIAFAYFFPEWVGITGKQALKVQAHQKEDPAGTKHEPSKNDID